MVRRLFAWLLGHRLALAAFVLAVTGLFGAFAGRVQPDYSVEHFFPVWSESRQVYDRFKTDFPHEDTQALVIVEAPDLFTTEGLRRIEDLEEELRGLPHVTDVDGPLSVQDIDGSFGDLTLEELFPDPDLGEEELARRKEIATGDPLFAWNLATPDGSAVTIRVSLSPDAVATDAGRQEFYAAARELAESHQSEAQRIVLSGIPVIRARFAEMVQGDMGRMIPIAFAVVLAILLLAFRNIGAVLAGTLTILLSVVWTVGFMGMLGLSFTVLSSILPIVVMIISVSDTVHIVNDFFARRREGEERREALAGATATSAGPCLATEIVIACGFLSLLAVNIVGIVEFGLAAAVGMMLTWLANVTVLPLALSVTKGVPMGRDRATGEAPPMVRWFGRFIEWIGRQVTGRPRRVVLTAALIGAVGAVFATRVEKLSYSFDDLYPDSEFYKELRFAEEKHGGLVPVAIYVEWVGDERENPVLEPEILRLLDRSSSLLESFPEVRQATSVADFLRKGHRLFAGGEDLPPDGLPDSRELAAQEVLFLDEDRMLRDVLSFDREAAAALGFSVDADSERVAEMFEEIDRFVEEERGELPEGYRIASTGQLRVFRDVNDTLVDGLVLSFGGAVLATLVVFCLVLRSVKLGLIGILPNVSPMVLTVAFMAIAGITLRPSTVVLFSIILVIADDDTIQYLARLRRQYRLAKERDPSANLHREAALGAMRESGLPMFITSTSVSAGFLLLTLSELRGSADLGLLIGVTLFFAIFADLFLGPILVEKVKPKLD